METGSMRRQPVYTNKARCRDCYRCVRVCPVKAIRMRDNQAFVVEERCISCGTCIRECPQRAKTFRNDVDRASILLRSGRPVAVSMAPSFTSVFTGWERTRIASALRTLGFSYVAETAVGAWEVARESRRFIDRNPGSPHIASACPAVVTWIERYHPAAARFLIPVSSPMIAHGRMLKARLGPDAAVVFVGPCVAKKAEAERPELAGAVDCVLTFIELAEWLAREGIDIAACEESRFNEEPAGDSRTFPLVGGCLRTASLSSDMLAPDIVAASGFEELEQLVSSVEARQRPIVVEPLFCLQGCINGPAIGIDRPLIDRRQEVLGWAVSPPDAAGAAAAAAAWTAAGSPAPADEPPVPLGTRFTAGPAWVDQPITEEEIDAVFEKTGKTRPEDRLNCGACGYPTCRAKAIAVIRGMAEAEMCIPVMKRLAEQRTDRIIDTSPNGIVILDERLAILSMNPSFRKFFMCSDAVCGRHISYLMDPDPFERLTGAASDKEEFTAAHERYGIVCHQILYALREERQYVGIFVNITQTEDSRRRLDSLKARTALQARELMEHQVEMAQKIAAYLGESTAQSEALVEKLLELSSEEEKQKAQRPVGKARPWDTSTSK
jgi:iron only hydrogenase large subunit-like protein